MSRGMTNGRNLWLGFGAIAVLLTLACAANLIALVLLQNNATAAGGDVRLPAARSAVAVGLVLFVAGGIAATATGVVLWRALLRARAGTGDEKETLREPDQRFSRFMQHLPGLAWIKDLDGRYVYANDAAVRAFRCPREELYGKTDAEIFPPDTAAQFRENDQRAFQSGAVRTVEALEQEDGVHHSLVSKFPIPGATGDPVLVGGMAIDVTDRYRAEAQHRELSGRLQILLESTSHLIETLEAEPLLNSLLDLSRKMVAADAFGVWRRDAEGMWSVVSSQGLSDEFLRVSLPSGRGADLTPSPIVVQPEDLADRSTPILRERWSRYEREGISSLMILPLRIHGELSGTLVFYCRSAHRFTPTEIDSAQALSHIAAAVITTSELYRNLRDSERRLKEADRRKDEFLATLAHELRNPLAPIRTGLEVMKLAKNDPEKLELVRGTMERQTQQLIALVNDLLDVSRITRGKLELRRSCVALADIVESAVEASRPFLDDAGHELSIALPTQPIHLHADPHRLAQVLSNLLNNAAKYTPAGGRIWLTGKFGRRKAEPGTEEESGNSRSAVGASDSAFVELSVKDTGIGIPPEMQGRIFEMFAQIDRRMETGYPGLGIGLTLARRLVEMHGGVIEARSDGPNLGSEFIIRLPIVVETPDPAPVASAADGDGAPIAVNRRVLVVDDNAEAAEMLRLSISMLGSEVRIAGDGREAIDVAAEFLPDVVLMDLGMPQMNGYEAARRMREQPWGKNLLLVALTGWGQDENRQRTKEAGFDHHLVKPAEPSELRRLLSAMEGC